jgi:hypothetical protein
MSNLAEDAFAVICEQSAQTLIGLLERGYTMEDENVKRQFEFLNYSITIWQSIQEQTGKWKQHNNKRRASICQD